MSEHFGSASRMRDFVIFALNLISTILVAEIVAGTNVKKNVLHCLS